MEETESKLIKSNMHGHFLHMVTELYEQIIDFNSVVNWASNSELDEEAARVVAFALDGVSTQLQTATQELESVTCELKRRGAVAVRKAGDGEALSGNEPGGSA